MNAVIVNSPSKILMIVPGAEHKVPGETPRWKVPGDKFQGPDVRYQELG